MKRDRSFDQYVKEIRSFNLLSREEESALLEETRQGNLNARNKLIQAHLKQVIPLAQRFVSPHHDLPDLVQEGNYHLVKAIPSYNPEKGRCSTFITTVIQNALTDYRRKKKTLAVSPDILDQHIREDADDAKTFLEDLVKPHLAALTTQEQSLITHIYYENLPASIVQEQLDINSFSFRRIHYTALKKLFHALTNDPEFIEYYSN